jgi:SAM-dependent methyltransferase
MTATTPAYDRIGRSYARHRRPDRRIAARIVSALADARSVIDVGAGTGSYEPRDRLVVAVEPSWVTIAQRAHAALPVLRGNAEALPFGDDTFDAAMAIPTVHHWNDFRRGLAEMQRVARRRVVVLTWDRDVVGDAFWLARDYFPEVREAECGIATLDEIVAALGPCTVQAVPVPHDCTDGFFGAYWRRPGAYLDPDVRGSISGLARLGDTSVRPAIERLASDLASGDWDRRYGHLHALEEIDLGYRLVIGDPA